MGLFEFLMILLSVIIGLALTELLTGVASLLRRDRGAKAHRSWPHLATGNGCGLMTLARGIHTRRTRSASRGLR